VLEIITLYEQMEEEAATRPDMLPFFSWSGKFFLSGKSQGILIRDVCGNHVKHFLILWWKASPKNFFICASLVCFS